MEQVEVESLHNGEKGIMTTGWTARGNGERRLGAGREARGKVTGGRDRKTVGNCAQQTDTGLVVGLAGRNCNGVIDYIC